MSIPVETPSGVTRRGFLLEPGEPPLLSRSPIVAGDRFGEFCEVTGMAPDDVETSPLASFPAPRYRGHYPNGRRRWPGVRAEAMWHPLMWLPARLAGRAVLERDPDGNPTLVENGDEWLVRVGLEMGMSGLYEQETGGWVDVLALHGLDVGDPGVLTRLDNWLDGTPDAVLDGIDLEEQLLVEDDPWWALVVAAGLIPLLTECSYALTAQALIEAVDDVVLAGPQEAGWAGTTGQAVGAMLASIAATHLPEPAADDVSWPGLAAAMYHFDGSLDALFGGPMARFAGELRRARDAYGPRLAELDEPQAS